MLRGVGVVAIVQQSAHATADATSRPRDSSDDRARRPGKCAISSV
jgi:hypothetical protein